MTRKAQDAMLVIMFVFYVVIVIALWWVTRAWH